MQCRDTVGFRSFSKQCSLAFVSRYPSRYDGLINDPFRDVVDSLKIRHTIGNRDFAIAKMNFKRPAR